MALSGSNSWVAWSRRFASIGEVCIPVRFMPSGAVWFMALFLKRLC